MSCLAFSNHRAVPIKFRRRIQLLGVLKGCMFICYQVWYLSPFDSSSRNSHFDCPCISCLRTHHLRQVAMLLSYLTTPHVICKSSSWSCAFPSVHLLQQKFKAVCSLRSPKHLLWHQGPHIVHGREITPTPYPQTAHAYLPVLTISPLLPVTMNFV